MTDKYSALRSNILEIIGAEVAEVSETYNKKAPYQSYERIGFSGIRWSVEKRISEYRLDRFLGKDKTILDIGSNFGFFVVEFAHSCQMAHGVEWNRHLNQIGELTAEALSVSDKVKYYTSSFEKFASECAYDTVFSLAAFYTADGHERTAASQYFAKIKSILKDGGIVFYESTSYTKIEGSEAYSHYVAKASVLEWLQQNMDVIEAYETSSGSEGYFRQFAVARRH